METNELLQIVIVLGVCLMFLVPIIKALLDYLIRKPKKVRIETQDIMQDVYKRRLKIAKSQKPRSLRRITFIGDEDCHGASYNRIRGYIPDTRFTEFFIKLRWYNWFPVWVVVPSKYISNLVAGEVFIDARGLRNTGVIYGVVNNQKHSKEEEEIRREEHKYIDSILRHEEISHLQEERVNSMIVASTFNVDPVKWISHGEMTADGQKEEEEMD